MNLAQLFILLGAFGVTVGVVFVLYRLVTHRHRAVAERFHVIQLMQSESELRHEIVDPVVRSRSRVGVLETWLSGSRLVKGVGQRLIAGGVALKAWEFAGLVIMSTVSGALVGLLGIRSVFAAVGFAVLGYAVPNVLLNWRVGRRRAQLEKQLATAVRLISASMQAGHAFQSGLGTAAEQMPAPISAELQRVVGQINRGVGVEQALRQMSERIGSYDFDLFVNAVTIQLRSGGRVTEILDNISTTIRQRISLNREVSAASAQGKLSGAVLVLVPVGIAGALMVINPSYGLLLVTTKLGLTMVKAALIMQFLGILVIRKVLRIRV